MPLLVKRKILAAAIEGTTGTAAALSSSNAAFNVFDLKYTADIPSVERQGQGSLSMLAPIAGARKADIEFYTELVGSGGSGNPNWMDTFLVSCGFVNTSGGLYAPTSARGTYSSLTIGHYQDGRLYKATGCVGNLMMKFKAGEPVKLQWKFSGVHIAPSSVSLLTPTYPTTIAPRFAGGTLTLGGTSYLVNEMEIDLGNTVSMREDAGNANGAGYIAAIVTGRKPIVKIDPEALSLGSQDWYAGQLASTGYALNCVVGSASNNTFTIAAPNMVLNKAPEMKDRNGVLADQLEFLCARSTSAGDDELTITAS